jgi:hypothetical protein
MYPISILLPAGSTSMKQLENVAFCDPKTGGRGNRVARMHSLREIEPGIDLTQGQPDRIESKISGVGGVRPFKKQPRGSLVWFPAG